MKILTEHSVSYSDCDAGVHELGWAQRDMLDYINARGPGGLVYVTKFGSLGDGPADLASVLDAIRLTCENNDAFRTRYVQRDGRWMQEILGAGEMSVTELAATSPQLDEAAVVALLGPLAPEPDEIPVRVAVIGYEGRPTHVYLAIHHSSVDNMGAEIACEEICRRSLGLPVLTSSAWQPHQIVEFEASPAGRALAEKADEYHRARLHDLADFGAPPADRSVTPLREYRLTSSAVVVAAQQIAHRLNVSAVNVVVAAYCVALAGRSAQERLVLAVTSGNRFHPRLRMSVAKVAQATSLSVDVAVPTFEDLCRQVNSATLLAYRYGIYDPELLAAAHRDTKTAYFPYLVNFHLTTPIESPDRQTRDEQRRQLETAVELPAAALRDLLDRGVCEAVHPDDGLRFTDLSLDIYEFSERADMRLRTDLAVFPDTELRDLLLRTERLLVDIACGRSEASEMPHLTARQS